MSERTTNLYKNGRHYQTLCAAVGTVALIGVVWTATASAGGDQPRKKSAHVAPSVTRADESPIRADDDDAEVTEVALTACEPYAASKVKTLDGCHSWSEYIPTGFTPISPVEPANDGAEPVEWTVIFDKSTLTCGTSNKGRLELKLKVSARDLTKGSENWRKNGCPGWQGTYTQADVGVINCCPKP